MYQNDMALHRRLAELLFTGTQVVTTDLQGRTALKMLTLAELSKFVSSHSYKRFVPLLFPLTSLYGGEQSASAVAFLKRLSALGFNENTLTDHLQSGTPDELLYTVFRAAPPGVSYLKIVGVLKELHLDIFGLIGEGRAMDATPYPIHLAYAE